jgi:organic radical activating enzyme
MNDEIKLIECIRTWQGEGKDCGRAALLVRFKACNLKCPWCDTSVKMRITPESTHRLSEIQELIYENKLGLMITGGEPTISRHYEDMIKLLNLDYIFANIETNGFNLEGLISDIAKIKKTSNKEITVVYSPKIFNEDDLKTAFGKTEYILQEESVIIKVVFEPTNEEMNTYLDWCSSRDLLNGRIYLMPEGVTRADLIKNSEKVFDAAEKYKFNFSSRDHIIYGFV